MGDDIVEHLRQRLRHPFIGAFSISFIIYNWKSFLFATTGELSPESRIEQIVNVTVGSGEHVDWTFVIHPLGAALLTSLVILPFGSLIIALVSHLSIVIENNLKDWINKKWNNSDELKYRKCVDLNSYARGRLGQLRNLTNKNNEPIAKEDVLKFIDEASNVLDPISRDEADLIKTIWQRLKNENKI